MMKNLCTISLILAIAGCSVAEAIEPAIPISEDPTAVETAVGVGVVAVLASAAFFMFSLAAVVNEAGS